MKFTPRTTPPTSDNKFYFEENIFYQSGVGMPNCTDYSVGRYNELGGNSGWKIVGDAGDFYKNAKKNGVPVGDKPKLGAIACFPNHVCNVEEINGDILKCSQSHYNGVYFDFVEIDMKKPEYKGQALQGFIYLPFEFEPEDPVYYRVQVGAYSVFENAVKMYNQLTADGYKPIIKQAANGMYRVQVGAYTVKANAMKVEAELKFKGYSTYITTEAGTDVPVPKTTGIKVGDKVMIKPGATDCDGRLLAAFCYTRKHDVKALNGERAVISYEGVTIAAMNIKSLIKA